MDKKTLKSVILLAIIFNILFLSNLIYCIIGGFYGWQISTFITLFMFAYHFDIRLLIGAIFTLFIKKNINILNKKYSSLVVGFNMLKDNEGDAFVSAGSTGAFMAGGLLMVGRIKGIDRPALCPILPTYDGKGFMLIDCGANTNCKPINLLQFAKMGSIYMNKVMHVDDPKVGLLNIGTEEGKGNELTKEAFIKFSETNEFNFYGNVEGRDIFNGDVNVVVSDGFTGNVTLKTIEGMGSMISKLLKEELNASIWRKILAALLMPALKNFKKRMDYSEYGGALLLGIKKPMIKCHGTANAKIVKYTLIQAENFAKNKVVETIENEIKKEE